ncbi:hypothetical protein Pmani_038815 [Petrolisthes manimaculis]|uniref:Uncharacterized protein n=1 Tax=Petrolisthes manimaculis TaxID=1843537 RepID=A0AAE1TLX7_9EUCA|nr:hypothetical protein Pmani_038815 [Petrolisthes manimaculis]
MNNFIQTTYSVLPTPTRDLMDNTANTNPEHHDLSTSTGNLTKTTANIDITCANTNPEYHGEDCQHPCSLQDVVTHCPHNT